PAPYGRQRMRRSSRMKHPPPAAGSLATASTTNSEKPSPAPIRMMAGGSGSCRLKASSPSLSHPPARRERDRCAVADHEVVEQAHVHQRQRLLELGGHRAVGGAGLGIAAGMVVA